MSGALFVISEPVVDIKEINVEVAVGGSVFQGVCTIGCGIVVVVEVRNASGRLGACNDCGFACTPPAVTAVATIRRADRGARPAGAAECKATGSTRSVCSNGSAHTDSSDHARHGRMTAAEGLPAQLK